MLSEVSRWLDSAVRDYAEVRDGGLCMQTGPECGHAEVSTSTLGLLPLEAGHIVGLSHGDDVWTEKVLAECNFWMTNLSSLSFFVIFCQRYQCCKLVNIDLRGITEGSGLDHSPFIALLHVSIHLTVHCFGERQMSYIISGSLVVMLP